MIDKKKYYFYDYKTEYPKLFEKEKKKLLKILPNAEIEHIGSTSVPNLGGKGILDILIILNREELNHSKVLLEKKGYILMKDKPKPDRISLKKDYGLFFFKRRVHIHLTWSRSDTHMGVLNFKINLLKNHKLRNEYGILKKEAVKISEGDGKVYKKIKENFIKKYSKK